LGDLHLNNLRQILCELEINSSIEQTREIQMLTFELSYLVGVLGATERNTISGHLDFTITSDDKLMSGKNSSVEVFYIIQQAAESDLIIKAFIQKRDSKSAEKELESQISLLESVLDIDTSGMIPLLLKVGKATLQKLKRQGPSSEMERESEHREYMKRRGSNEYCQGYADLLEDF